MFDTTLGQYTCTLSSNRYQIMYNQDKKKTKTKTKKSQSILFRSLINTINLATALTPPRIEYFRPERGATKAICAKQNA